jgi:hypothetical protein
VADEEEPATQSDREQVISLIAKYAKQLASLAQQQGCMSLYYLLQTAAEQAEQDLAKSRSKSKSGPS